MSDLTWSSKTSCTPSNSFSNLPLRHIVSETRSNGSCIAIDIAPGQRKSRGSAPSSSNLQPCQWLAGTVVPGRELLVCLVLATGEALRGSAEVAGAGGSQSHRGLHPGPDDRSSDKAGRADGARRDTEDRQERHVGVECWDPGELGFEVVKGEWMETWKGGGRSRVEPGWILRVVRS